MTNKNIRLLIQTILYIAMVSKKGTIIVVLSTVISVVVIAVWTGPLLLIARSHLRVGRLTVSIWICFARRRVVTLRVKCTSARDKVKIKIYEK